MSFTERKYVYSNDISECLIKKNLVLVEEKDGSEMREISVNTAYGLLKKTDSDRYSFHLLRFIFWVEN